MYDNEINEAFANAYNNFSPRPLSGETLKNFYIDDFTKEAVESIRTTIQDSEPYCKILVIGHRGCGKSTILNKVSEELNNDFHLVSFSATDTLNMKDVETVDILISIYVQLLNSVENLNFNDNKIKLAFEKFNEIMKSIKQNLKINEVGINFLKTLSLKIRVENESRDALRKEFHTKIDTLTKGISNCISSINDYYKLQNNQNKQVLLIIDDLDKLETEFAQKVFFKDYELMTVPKVKIVYTFPLETYYSPDFIRIKDCYEEEFISLVLIDEKKNGNIGIQQLEKLILKRIDKQYIEDEALKEIIHFSGGLLRDLMKLMRDGCKKARARNTQVINKKIAEDVINNTVNHYDGTFEFIKYQDAALKIMETHNKRSVQNEDLIYLLRYLFVLEYRLQNEKHWYDVHPCLKKILNCEDE